MKLCVVGYGAMGRIVCELAKEELAYPVSLECEFKTLEETDKCFDCIIDFSHPSNLDMIVSFAKKYHKPVVFATTGFTEKDRLKNTGFGKKCSCTSKCKFLIRSHITKPSCKADYANFKGWL